MSILRTTTDGRKIFWCPGCENPHSINVDQSKRPKPTWTWNGSSDKPTFSPSIKVTTPWSRGEPGEKDDICHSFVKDGMIQFLNDCTHKLAGQTVPLPEWPYAKDQYGGVID